MLGAPSGRHSRSGRKLRYWLSVDSHPVIGLYAAGLAVSMGASEVVYWDADEQRRKVATDMGAKVLDDDQRSAPLPSASSSTRAATVDGLQRALAAAEPEAHFHKRRDLFRQRDAAAAARHVSSESLSALADPMFARRWKAY